MALWQIPHRIWPQRSTLSGMSGRLLHMNSSDQSHQQALPDLSICFSSHAGNEQYHSIRERFLFHYATNIANKTSLFRESLNYWNDYVTSKSAGESSQTKPIDILLIEKIGLNDADCIISFGDTAPRPKLYLIRATEATKRLRIRPEECWFVGDDPRDIQAGKAAGTGTIAAQWGYCTRPTGMPIILQKTPGYILRLVHSVSAK